MPRKYLRIVQLNANKQHMAVEQIRDFSVKRGVDIILLQDPPTNERVIRGFALSCGKGSVMRNDHRAIIFNLVVSRATRGGAVEKLRFRSDKADWDLRVNCGSISARGQQR